MTNSKLRNSDLRDYVVHKRDNAKIELVQYIQSLSLSEEMISLIIISFYSAQCPTANNMIF